MTDKVEQPPFLARMKQVCLNQGFDTLAEYRYFYSVLICADCGIKKNNNRKTVILAAFKYIPDSELPFKQSAHKGTLGDVKFKKFKFL